MGWEVLERTVCAWLGSRHDMGTTGGDAYGQSQDVRIVHITFPPSQLHLYITFCDAYISRSYKSKELHQTTPYNIQHTLHIDVFTFVHIQSRNLYFDCMCMKLPNKRAERRKIQANQYKCRRRTVVRRKYQPCGQQGKANMPVRAPGSYERPLSKECDSAFTAHSLEVCLDQEEGVRLKLFL